MENEYNCRYCGKEFHDRSKNSRMVLASHYKACPSFRTTNHQAYVQVVDYEYTPRVDVLENEYYGDYIYDQQSEESSNDSDGSTDTLIVRETDRLASKYDDTFNAIPCHDTLLFQYTIRDKYIANSSVPFNVQNTSGSWQDFVLVHEYVKKHNLSATAGDDLILLIRNICGHQNLEIKLPKKMRTILDAIKRCMGDVYLYETVLFKYPRFLLDELDFPGEQLGYLGTFLNPLQILAEYLLQLKDGDMIFSPYQEVSSVFIVTS
jgi:hypothetical protein